MTYANANYPNMTENFQSLLKCVYPVFDKYGQITCNNNVAQKHTVWVKDYILEHSKIIKEAVDKGELYLAKCHFDHNSGEVFFIDHDLNRLT